MKAVVLLTMSLVLSMSAKAAEAKLSFGIVPQQSAKTLAARWAPLLNELSARSGVQLTFATAKNIPTFEQRLSQGQYDIAYMNPYHFVVFSADPGYQALVKQRDKSIRGIVVVRKDAEINALTELAENRLAFPAPAAFAASILPRAEFRKQGIKITPQYVSSHDSVYLSVAKGLFPAGGGVIRTLNNTPEEVREQLRILWKTAPYTPHAIATHPRIDESTRERLHMAFLLLNDNPEAQRLLKAINFKGFETAANQDWQDVAALGIDSL